MSEENVRLKPCPFCGRNPMQFGVLNAYRCDRCSVNNGYMSMSDWNTRAADQEGDLIAEKLVSAIMDFDHVKCSRIALKSGKYPNEQDEGGFNRDALTEHIKQTLAKIENEKTPIQEA